MIDNSCNVLRTEWQHPVDATRVHHYHALHSSRASPLMFLVPQQQDLAWDSVMSSIQQWGWREDARGTLDSLPGIRRSSSTALGISASWGQGIVPFWGTERVAGWSARARQSVGQTTRAVGVRVGQTSSIVYRFTLPCRSPAALLLPCTGHLRRVNRFVDRYWETL